jgi:hypothetical protein
MEVGFDRFDRVVAHRFPIFENHDAKVVRRCQSAERRVHRVIARDPSSLNICTEEANSVKEGGLARSTLASQDQEAAPAGCTHLCRDSVEHRQGSFNGCDDRPKRTFRCILQALESIGHVQSLAARRSVRHDAIMASFGVTPGEAVAYRFVRRWMKRRREVNGEASVERRSMDSARSGDEV